MASRTTDLLNTLLKKKRQREYESRWFLGNAEE
jgi:hypothetical protein